MKYEVNEHEIFRWDNRSVLNLDLLDMVKAIKLYFECAECQANYN